MSSDAFSLIPPNAIYLFETETPIESWKTISSSAQWQHLQKNSYFASLTSAANSLDSQINDNSLLFELIGSRSLIVSTHLISSKDYDFLFLVDLKEASMISVVQDYLTTASGAGYTMKKEKYRDDILLLLQSVDDNSILYLVIKDSYLVASYSKILVTASIDAYQGINLATNATFVKHAAQSRDGLLSVYIHYLMLPGYLGVYMDGQNEYVSRFSQSLLTSRLDLSLSDDQMKISGLTIVNDSIESYVKSLYVSGKGPTDITQITPQRTAFYLGLGFSSFDAFFKNFESNLKQDVAEYNAYKENIKQVEDFLKIDLQKNIIDWIGDEVAILELQSAGEGLHNEAVVVLKAHNIEQARDNLEYIEKMIRRRTPVRFKAMEHRGYSISYLSVKGLFQIILGKFFARYDKPYYTIINNYVIFSNHPESIKSIIDDYLDKKTLARSEAFRKFRKEFEDESSVFVYMHAPTLFNTVKNLANPVTRTAMTDNKDFIICFRDMGIQLSPAGEGFETIMIEQFVAPEAMTISKPIKKAEPTIIIAEIEPEEKDAGDPMALPEIYTEDANLKEYVAYFADSTVHFQIELKNGFKEGLFIEYYPNGETKMTGKFRKDLRYGNWRLFDETGALILRRDYKDGRITHERIKD